MAVAIHILTGKNKGHEYLLPEAGSFHLTNAGDDELHFNSTSGPQVAVLSAKGDNITLCDVGSAGGVFVNRKRCAETALQEGDQVRIGKTRFLLVKVIKYSPVAKAARARAAAGGSLANEPTRPASRVRTPVSRVPGAPTFVPQAPARSQPAARRSAAQIPESGTLQEYALGKLLRHFCSLGECGILSMIIEGDIGAVQINAGQVADAFIASSPAPSAKRALYRLFRWQAGEYVWQPGEPHPIESSLNLPLAQMLTEAEAESGEIAGLLAALPPPDTRLAAANLPRGGLAKLAPPEMFILGLVRMHGTVRAVIDHHPENDLVVCRLLESLLRRNILCIPVTP